MEGEEIEWKVSCLEREGENRKVVVLRLRRRWKKRSRGLVKPAKRIIRFLALYRVVQATQEDGAPGYDPPPALRDGATASVLTGERRPKRTLVTKTIPATTDGHPGCGLRALQLAARLQDTHADGMDQAGAAGFGHAPSLPDGVRR